MGGCEDKVSEVERWGDINPPLIFWLLHMRAINAPLCNGFRDDKQNLQRGVVTAPVCNCFNGAVAPKGKCGPLHVGPPGVYVQCFGLAGFPPGLVHAVTVQVMF
jgi:hypothetical protein